MRNYAILSKVVSSGRCRKWTDSDFILKVELTFTVGLNLECEENTGVINESINFGLSNRKHELAN